MTKVIAHIGRGKGQAERVAARRRNVAPSGRAPRESSRRTPRGGSPRGAKRGLPRGLKLALLCGGMTFAGFSLVLMSHHVAAFIGRIHLGETTLHAVTDKIINRVLDRDLPRRDIAPSSSSGGGSRDEVARQSMRANKKGKRAEMDAPAPDQYAHESDPGPVASQEPHSKPSKSNFIN